MYDPSTLLVAQGGRRSETTESGSDDLNGLHRGDDSKRFVRLVIAIPPKSDHVAPACTWVRWTERHYPEARSKCVRR